MLSPKLTRMDSFSATQPNASSKIDFRKTTLLIIEDNPDHLFLIKSALNECMPGVDSIGVDKKEDALNFLTTQGKGLAHQFPKLILSDLYLPSREEGIGVVQAIKVLLQSVKLPPVPIVMFSYSDQEADIRDCYAHGANAYIIKSPNYQDWANYFINLREFWLETVSLPQRG